MSLNYEDYEPRLNTKDKLERKRKKKPQELKKKKNLKVFLSRH